jgi:hypothetical protein
VGAVELLVFTTSDGKAQYQRCAPEGVGVFTVVFNVRNNHVLLVFMLSTAFCNVRAVKEYSFACFGKFRLMVVRIRMCFRARVNI